MNYYDPTGTSCKEHGSYYVPTCTYCSPDRRNYLNTKRGMDYYNQKNGTNYIGVDNSGNFVKRNFSQKVVDSVGALIFSAQADFDVGLGFGANFNVMDMVEVSAILKICSITLHADESGFDSGILTSLTGGISICSWDFISIEEKAYRSFVTGEEEESFSEGHVIGISGGVYAGLGVSGRIGWNLDYVTNEWNKIWR